MCLNLHCLSYLFTFGASTFCIPICILSVQVFFVLLFLSFIQIFSFPFLNCITSKLSPSIAHIPTWLSVFVKQMIWPAMIGGVFHSSLAIILFLRSKVVPIKYLVKWMCIIWMRTVNKFSTSFLCKNMPIGLYRMLQHRANPTRYCNEWRW